MSGISAGAAQAMATTFPWDRYQTVIDIGCAEGCVPVQLARGPRAPERRRLRPAGVGPLFDEYVAAAGLADRLRFYPATSSPTRCRGPTC